VQFINQYGSGSVCEFFSVYNPFSRHKYLNLLDSWIGIFSTLASPRSDPNDGQTLVPFPLYFEPGGLFPWGTTVNGEELFWKTDDNPDRWTMVVIGRDSKCSTAQ
jgi:hypothetical protein